MVLISLSDIFHICSLTLDEMITFPLNQISVIPQRKAMVLELCCIRNSFEHIRLINMHLTPKEKHLKAGFFHKSML